VPVFICSNITTNEITWSGHFCEEDRDRSNIDAWFCGYARHDP
jgi:hypothetical protein